MRHDQHHRNATQNLPTVNREVQEKTSINTAESSDTCQSNSQVLADEPTKPNQSILNHHINTDEYSTQEENDYSLGTENFDEYKTESLLTKPSGLLNSDTQLREEKTEHPNSEVNLFFSEHRPKCKTAGQNSTKHGYNQYENETVNIITCNIEGVKSNLSFFQSLAVNNRILCFQEHFLGILKQNF